MKRLLSTVLFVAGIAGLGACASADTVDDDTPDLPLMSTPTTPGYPDLRSVPRTSMATTNQGYWAGVQNEVMAAVEDLRDNPRASYGAPPEDPAIFLEEARDDLMETRDSH